MLDGQIMPAEPARLYARVKPRVPFMVGANSLDIGKT